MTPEALLALLRSHQDGVYTACLHVLRNFHDAEDAAQEAMLKVASGAKDLRDPGAFKSWLYRLVFRTAVDHARRRATRRRIEEGSVPMCPAPLTDEQRDAIHEAMAALPDDERLMLVEHYFEKTPIVELGRREGISDVAMGKRLDKAREKLKQGLASAGILLAATHVSHALESVTWVSAPTGLASKAALVAAGGVIMGAKNYSIGLVVGAAMVFFALGAGGGYIVGVGRRAGRPSDSAASSNSNRAPLRPEASNVAPSSPKASHEGAPVKEPGAKPPAESAGDRLIRFRSWWRAWVKEEYDTKSLPAYHQYMGKLWGQGPQLREILLKDVDALLVFLRDTGNSDCMQSLMNAVFQPWRQQGNGMWYVGDWSVRLDELPPALSEGLLDLLANGSEAQQMAVMEFTANNDQKLTPEFLAEYRKLLASPYPEMALRATVALAARQKLTSADLEVVKRNAESSPAVGVRAQSYAAVAMSGTPESLDWLFSQLIAPRDAKTTTLVAEAIHQWVMNRYVLKEVEPRAAEALAAAFSREIGESDYSTLMRFSLTLSSDSIGRILELAPARAPTDDLRNRALAILESFRNGERNSMRLLQQFTNVKK